MSCDQYLSERHNHEKLMLMLAMTLALTLTASMARADDWYDAWAAYQSGDYATTSNLLKSLAEQGDADAQYNLGLMYAKGEGVLQDKKKPICSGTLPGPMSMTRLIIISISLSSA
jgi:TPR repeat protein